MIQMVQDDKMSKTMAWKENIFRYVQTHIYSKCTLFKIKHTLQMNDLLSCKKWMFELN